MASRRQYLSQDELIEYADITIVDSTEADDRISQAEELIDSYAGFQCKHVREDIRGRAVGGGSATFNLEVNQQNLFEVDYLKYCEVEIIGGTGAGQRRTISTNVKESGLVTVSSAWTTQPDSTSIYRIYQLGKFPRDIDSFLYSNSEPYLYAKSIPEAVKRAVAAQVEYMIQMGDEFFASDKSNYTREQIGDYEYEKKSNAGGGTFDMIAPKARSLLKGIRNITGEII